MILRCTGKLLRLLRISPASVAEGRTIPDKHEWYALGPNDRRVEMSGRVAAAVSG
jgi:hypothetical protein